MQYHIVCANPTCRAVKVVTRFDQRRRRFCSRACAGTCSAITRLTKAQRLAAANASKRVRQAAAMRRVAGLSPLEAYKLAYAVGWKAGVRAERRRNGRNARGFAA